MGEDIRKILIFDYKDRKYCFELKRKGDIKPYSPLGEPYLVHRSYDFFYKWMERAISATSDTIIDLVIVKDTNDNVQLPSWNFSRESVWKLSEIYEVISEVIKESFCILVNEEKHYVQLGNVRDHQDLPILYAVFSAATIETGSLGEQRASNKQQGFVDEYFRRKLGRVMQRDVY